MGGDGQVLMSLTVSRQELCLEEGGCISECFFSCNHWSTNSTVFIASSFG